ncbi:MAG: hypothetical protein CSA62_12630 [Planctomycetota bacterium]|nr:MAG: hypothetical protein CSA62_12630 [Planctomycetota bacterium]
MKHEQHKLDCRSISNLLGESFDGRLARHEALAVRAHLLQCPSCRRAYGELERLREWTQGLPVPSLSNDFQDKLFERIHSGEGASMAILPQARAVRGIAWFVSGMATAAALLLSAWLLFGGSGSKEPNESASRLAVNSNEFRTPQQQASRQLAAFPDTLGLRPADAMSVARRLVQNADESFQRTLRIAQRAKHSRDSVVLRNQVLPSARESYLSAGVALRLQGQQIDLLPETAAYLREVHRHTQQIASCLQSSHLDLERFERIVQQAAEVHAPKRITAQFVFSQKGAGTSDGQQQMRIEIRRVLPPGGDVQALQTLCEIFRRQGLRLQMFGAEGKLEVFESSGR